MLILAGLELIFFTVASTGLCFGLAGNIDVFIIPELGLHRSKALSAPHPSPPARRVRVHKELGGDPAGTADWGL